MPFSLALLEQSESREEFQGHLDAGSSERERARKPKLDTALKRARQRGDSCLVEIRHVIFTGGKWSFGFMVFFSHSGNVANTGSGGVTPKVHKNQNSIYRP